MDVAGKRLLIIGAGRGQVGLYKAAKEMGIHTIAGTLPDNNPPGIALADEVCYMDIANVEDVVDKAKKLNLDGVATCCLDTGIPALGAVCDKLGLVGLSSEAARICGDKLSMKKKFIDNDVSTAKFYKVSSQMELEKALSDLSMPVIIKATDLQGSNGIYIANTREEALYGYKGAMEKTKREFCIVEEFIEGWEFGAQAFVSEGEVLFVMPHGDETFMSHTAVPVGHYVPLKCEQKILEQTIETVKGAIKAIGLNNCAVNVDLIERNGKVYVIELTGRVGANCLPELVEINYGIEYYKMIALAALGGNPRDLWNLRNEVESAGLAKMILETEKAGLLKEISLEGPVSNNVVEVTFFKKKGDMIRVFENSNDCIGQVIVRGETLEQCEKTMKSTLEKVSMTLSES